MRSRNPRWFLVLVTLFGLAGMIAALPALAATFVVRNTNESGPGSFHQALLDANATPAADTITFNIPGAGVRTIRPTISLPTITSPVTIDGYFQPGARPNTRAVGSDADLRIELNGEASPAGVGDPVLLRVDADGCVIRGLVINRVAAGTALLLRSRNNVVEGCYIGTNAAGNAALPSRFGISAGGFVGGNNRIGGTAPAARNLISGNVLGLSIAAPEAGTVVQGNYIGTDASGMAPLGNTSAGINVNSFIRGITIGGTAAGAGNLISGNGVNSGILVSVVPAQNGTGDLVIQGNIIGLNALGTAAIPNNEAGINVTTDAVTSGTIRIGGTTPAARNLISGNNRGIIAGADNMVIQGNLIGTDVTGMVDLGNGEGIFMTDRPEPFQNVTVGGLSAEARNVISGSVANGINMRTANATIQGNFIGVAEDGVTPLPNGQNGILTRSGRTTVGGTAAGAGNVIAYNGLEGVLVEGPFFAGQPQVTAVLGNSIHSNGQRGITLTNGGIPPNDPQDPDTGPNQRQNFPVLTSATAGAGGTTLRGTLNSTPNTTFRVEFFLSNVADPSGSGEGQFFLGAISVRTNAQGDAAFAPPAFRGPVRAGQVVTATATDPAGNTSEFSVNRAVTGAPALPALSINNVTVTEGGAGNAVFTVALSRASAQPVTVRFATANGSATAGQDYQARAGTLTFAANDTSETVSVPVTDDAEMEANEEFTVTLSNPAGATLADAQGQGTIVDNEQRRPAFSVSDVSLVEGTGGTRDAVFRVSVTPATEGGLDGTITVQYATANGTATAGQDYQQRTGTLTFEPGDDLFQQIPVPVVGDTVDEPTETFTITLSNPTNAVLADEQGTGTITDDDEPTPTTADLALTMRDSRDPVVVGSRFSYLLAVRNNGPATATGVALTVPLPASVAFVSSTPAPTTRNGNRLTFNLGSLANAATRSFTITVTATAAGTVTNTATVTSGTTDPSAANNQATITTTVNPRPAGVGRLSATPNPVQFGQVNLRRTVRRRVTLRNVGNAPLAVTVGRPRAPFSARGATFTLVPGQRRVVSVSFRPRRNGSFTGTLPLTTNNTAQQRVSVRLLGKTCKPNPFE